MPTKWTPEYRKKQRRKWYLAHKDLEIARAIQWSKEHPEQVKKINKKFKSKPSTKAYYRKYFKKWYKKHKPENYAHSYLAEALKQGKMIRPTECSKCHVTCKPQAHHHKGYAEKYRLDVVWLCRPCHNKITWG
jgi:hypothetical protein